MGGAGRQFALLLALCCSPASALDAPYRLRGADHPGFGRLVLQLPKGAAYSLSQQDGSATIEIGGDALLPSDHRPPRNFREVTGAAGALKVTLDPGARLKLTRIGDRLVMDALDPKTDSTAAVPLVTPASPRPTAVPAPPPPISTPGSVRIAVIRADMPGTMSGSAILVPFDSHAGVAAFPRGDREIIVFDEASPLDLAQLAGDPQFGDSRLTELENATVLSLPLPAKGAVRLARVDDGWLVMQQDAPAANAPIEPAAHGSELFLPAVGAAKSVTVLDELTGGNLLVGTQRSPGEGVPTRRRAPEYQLIPSDIGVVIDPLSDRLGLRVEDDGFVLEASGPGPEITLPVGPTPALGNAAALSRRYDFPNRNVPDLLRLLQNAIVTSALAPPLSRFEPRYQVAQAMVALGLDAEAEAVMQTAIASDASETDNASARGLLAIAATLAGRLDDTAGLDDRRLDGCDEVRLWRAARDAMRQSGSGTAAKDFAATAALIMSYPAPLRQRLAPLAVETMALGGELQAAQALAARLPDDPGLALGRAIIAEKTGNVAAALAQYDALDASRDRDVRARAADRAVELRLAAGMIGPAEAADALEHQFLNWRGDGRELTLRERAAQLREQAHDWRKSLALLREAQLVVPADAPSIKDLMAEVLAAMLHADGAAALAPIDLVELADENADLIANCKQSDQLDAILADRLIALDLPDRAAPVLQKLIKSSHPGVGAARLGAKLAEVRLDQGQPQAALDVIAGGAVDGLPDDLVMERAAAAARAQAALGKPDAAAEILSAINDPKADDLRAQIYQSAKNWPGAEAALADLAAKTLPASGNSTDAERNIMVRWAGASAEAGDAARLKSLQAMVPRMGSGDSADLFKLLVEQPVTALSDLERAKSEDSLVGSVPGAVRNLR